MRKRNVTIIASAYTVILVVIFYSYTMIVSLKYTEMITVNKQIQILITNVLLIESSSQPNCVACLELELIE